MSREEIIRIFRSETIGATPSGMTAGELATNLADRKLFIGGTHGDNITFMAISSITGTANEIDVMVSATGSVVIGLVGSAGSLVGLATTSLTGVASFSSSNFAVSGTGHVTVKVGGIEDAQLASSVKPKIQNSQDLNDSSRSEGYFIVYDPNTQGYTGHPEYNPQEPGINHFYAPISSYYSPKFASASVTGVASFDPRHFALGASGHVSLTGAYQVTGQTVVSGYGINTVVSNNTVTVNNTGVTGFNGLSGNVSMTGAGALFGFGNNAIGIRNASASVTGVASFDPRYFTVGSTGHVGLTATFFSGENYPVPGGFSANGFTGDRLLLATGPANDPFRNYIRYENQWFQTGVVGVVGVTGDFGAVKGKPQNLITARLATASLTGFASFDSTSFKVTNGRVTLTTIPFTEASSGLGATADEDGNLISLYLDLNNIAEYDGTLGTTDAVFVYDTEELGIIKTKKTTIGKMLLDTDSVFSTSTQNQLQKSKDVENGAIKYGVVLGSIEPTSLGLIIGASAYQYFTQNTIKSFNGCTGDIGITGTANQVIVTGISCSQIVIGLPTSITITGTMNADRFIGRIDGGTF